MDERAFRVKTRPPEPAAEGVLRLVGAQVGPRWIVRVRLPDSVRDAGAQALEADGMPGEIIDTEQAFAGETADDAFASAEGWLRDRYEVLGPADVG